MNKERKLIIAGNWKMNKTVAEALDLVRDLKLELSAVKEADIVVCPPFTALGDVSKEVLHSNIRLGAPALGINPDFVDLEACKHLGLALPCCNDIGAIAPLLVSNRHRANGAAKPRRLLNS